MEKPQMLLIRYKWMHRVETWVLLDPESSIEKSPETWTRSIDGKKRNDLITYIRKWCSITVYISGIFYKKNKKTFILITLMLSYVWQKLWLPRNIHVHRYICVRENGLLKIQSIGIDRWRPNLLPSAFLSFWRHLMLWTQPLFLSIPPSCKHPSRGQNTDRLYPVTQGLVLQKELGPVFHVECEMTTYSVT